MRFNLFYLSSQDIAFFKKICDSYILITSYTLQPLLQGACTLHQIAHRKQNMQQNATDKLTGRKQSGTNAHGYCICLASCPAMNWLIM